jgi:hypothetical protein
VSLAARALALTTSALMEDAIMFFLECGFADIGNHCCYLRTQLERPHACVLHRAKLADYNPSKEIADA